MLNFIKEKAALIVVDMQNDFVRAGAAIEVPDARKTIPTISKLIAFARENDMPVIFTRYISGPKFIAFCPTVDENNCCRRGFLRYYKDLDKELLCADVVPELCPKPHDYIIDKYGYSAFHNTNLIDVLGSEGRDTVIIVGTVTQICVGDTVHGGYHLGLKMVVASDGVSSFDMVQHESALANIQLKYGLVYTADEIMERFLRG